jgi:hypothetical protein
MELFVVAAFLLASLALSVPAQSIIPPTTRVHEAGEQAGQERSKGQNKDSERDLEDCDCRSWQKDKLNSRCCLCSCIRLVSLNSKGMR